MTDEIKDNVFSLVKEPDKTKGKGYVRITFVDLAYGFSDDSDFQSEIIQADTFGSTDEMPGFIVFWREDPDELIGFYSAKLIRKIEVLNGYNPSEGD